MKTIVVVLTQKSLESFIVTHFCLVDCFDHWALHRPWFVRGLFHAVVVQNARRLTRWAELLQFWCNLFLNWENLSKLFLTVKWLLTSTQIDFILSILLLYLAAQHTHVTSRQWINLRRLLSSQGAQTWRLIKKSLRLRTWLLLEEHLSVFTDELSWRLCCWWCQVLCALVERTIFFVGNCWGCHSLVSYGWTGLSVERRSNVRISATDLWRYLTINCLRKGLNRVDTWFEATCWRFWNSRGETWVCCAKSPWFFIQLFVKVSYKIIIWLQTFLCLC